MNLANIKNAMRNDNALYTFDEIFSTHLPQRVLHSLRSVKPDEILIINDKPIILFFHHNNSLSKTQIFKNCWNFSEAPIIIIENESDYEVYNGFEFIVESKELEKLPQKNLNYLSILNGEYYEELKSSKQSHRLDTLLLKNIKDAREKLLKSGLQKHRDIANSLIGRVIFIRYLIDRKVRLNKYKKILSNEDLQSILASKEKTYELFEYLKSDDGFNGDWFPIDKLEYDLVDEKHLSILKELISGTEIQSGQRSLFDIYDFSIIPIEFISNVYESFIGEEEQRKSGAYYTPTFLVDYILKHTVDEFFKNNPNEYNCKVLDPACGSGIFLVETFRKLVAQFERVNDKKITANELKQLAKDNIFGIDKDPSAVSISVFSLYLTMLDYQNPKEIESFTFPYLLKSDKNKKPNFFNSDFFDTDAPYNEILKAKELDFIVGNPPYGRGTIKKDSNVANYIKKQSIEVGNEDIVQPFMIRVKDFATTDTQIGFIATSKVLYNLQTKTFRTKHFFNNFKLNHILELSSVRKEIFENADVPVSILFYQKSNENEIKSHLINYISMKPNPYFKNLKILMLSRSDFKKILQTKLLENDYLWKILVYSSYLDFNFIKRLKSLPKISNELTHKPKQGITVGGSDKNPTDEYIGMPYVQTKQFKPFYILSTVSTWTKTYAHRNKNFEIFKAPSLLISKGINTDLEMKIGILQRDAIFTDSITALKTDNQNTLYGIMGTLYSSLFKYYILNIGSSITIEREQIHNPEKFSMPYIEDEAIIQSTKNLEKYSQNNFAQYGKEFDQLREQLNINVLKAFNLNEQEYALVDYANSIVIPWVIQKKYDIAFGKLPFEDKRLEEYVNITLNKNQEFYQNIGKFFQATILWSRYAIGVYYKVLDKASDKRIVWQKESNVENFLKLSNGKTLENLFIKKDIKGFESNGYYVIKPNEYKNWHKAIGYLDFYEFEKAILDASRGA